MSDQNIQKCYQDPEKGLLKAPPLDLSADGGLNGSRIVRGTAIEVKAIVSRFCLWDLAWFFKPHELLCSLLGLYYSMTVGLSFVHAELNQSLFPGPFPHY